MNKSAGLNELCDGAKCGAPPAKHPGKQLLLSTPAERLGYQPLQLFQKEVYCVNNWKEIYHGNL